MLPLGDCRDGCLMQIFQTANAVGTHREAVFRTGWVSVPFGIVPPIGGGSSTEPAGDGLRGNRRERCRCSG